MFAAPSVRVVGAEKEVHEGKRTLIASGAGGSTEKLCQSKCFAMVDSGSSFLGVPRELYHTTVRALTSRLLSELGSSACTPLGSSSSSDSSSGIDKEVASAGANPYALQACRCSKDDLLWYPRLEIELSTGESLALRPSDYLQLLPKRSQTPWCFLGIRPANHPAAEAPTFILGSSFLKVGMLVSILCIPSSCARGGISSLSTSASFLSFVCPLAGILHALRLLGSPNLLHKNYFVDQ